MPKKNQSPKLKTIKTIASAITGFCVGGTVITIVNNNAPAATKSQKVQLVIAAFVVGSMAADAARDYTNRQIDDIAEMITETKDELNNASTSDQ